ncbi:MAG TPA: RT0821/Lpp0805 family surface protein [Gammaproteobacteria bacterium]|nr:RT0821/Lpp0805 family surface protein [Gammaproteobacteria bacterium]
MVATLGLAGCATKQESGTAIGGVLGGVLGSQVGGGSGKTAATIAGTIAGAYLGGQVGKYMDETDRIKAQQALETNKTGQTSTWQNPDTGYDYTMTPTQTFKNNQDQYCREYTTKVNIGGETKTAYGTACRQPDGTWKVVNSQ